jgi:acyl-CoA synthetase (AMP-forming)/AMP-acid ligase II
MPVVRYRTGDLATLDPAPCACGRTLPRMSKVTGRKDDMLVIRGVNVYPSEVEAVLLAERERVAAEVGAALLERLGLTTEVRVLPAGTIPRGGARQGPAGRGADMRARSTSRVERVGRGDCRFSRSPFVS